MKKILIGGAGGAPSEGVIKSLLRSDKQETVIGMGSEPTDLVLSAALRKYIVPYANQPAYKDALMKILRKERPDFIHFQNDLEIFHASLIRDDIMSEGVILYMPSHEVIDTCVYKYKSYQKWKAAGIKVPETILLESEADLQYAFRNLADSQGRVWLRSSSIGAAGKGSAPAHDIDFAKAWIKLHNGWGEFTASQMLTSNTVTWLSLWYKGQLVVAQTRLRKGWVHGNRTVSGVTGVTKVGETFADEQVNDIALQAIKAVDHEPHGIYGVDMTYDAVGVPNPTEINIARFFTTVLFFTEAGLNMPVIYKDIALYNSFPHIPTRINPLPVGLMWIRSMDTVPRLITSYQLNTELISL